MSVRGHCQWEGVGRGVKARGRVVMDGVELAWNWHAASQRGNTTLIEAAARGLVGAIRLLLDQGADIEARNTVSSLPLMAPSGKRSAPRRQARLGLSRGFGWLGRLVAIGGVVRAQAGCQIVSIVSGRRR